MSNCFNMKSIFIDCNDQLAPIFARVRRDDDPPIVVNTAPFERRELPRVLDGYAICIDDHSYMPTDLVAQCKSRSRRARAAARGVRTAPC